MKHILIHTQYYPPEIGAPQARISELAQELSNEGFQIHVLTAMPNYPQGKIYPGYHGLVCRENQAGILITRCWIYLSQKVTFLQRLLSYFSFMITSFFVGMFIPGKFDYVLTESPPLFLGITGYILSRMKHARWIFNIADLWPLSVVELGVIRHEGRINRLSLRLELFLYRKAWLVSVQSRSILDNIQRRFPDAHTYLLSNGVETRKFRPKENTSCSSPKKVNFSYVGLHGLAQGLEQILLAANKLRDLENLKINLIGDGPEKQQLIRKAQGLGLTNVQFQDPVPHNEVPDLLSTADICIVCLRKTITGAVPSKLYEAMAVGKPVIIIATGEAADIVRQSGCGLVVNPGDIDGLAASIRYLIEHPDECTEMGIKGRARVEIDFDRRKICKAFSEYLITHATKPTKINTEDLHELNG